MTLLILHYMPACHWPHGEQSEGSGNRGEHGSKISIENLHLCFELLMCIKHTFCNDRNAFKCEKYSDSQLGMC